MWIKKQALSKIARVLQKVNSLVNVESPTDSIWVDKMQTPLLIQLHDQICKILDTQTNESDLYFP
jgi:hypothetical protein